MANSAFQAGSNSGAETIVQTVTEISSIPSNSAGAVIPIATTPQITDGAQLINVTITPKNSANKLLIRFYCPVTAHSGTGATVFSLFKVGTAAALTSSANSTTASNVDSASLEFHMLAGTTAALTFQIRYGVNTGGGAGASTYVLQSDAGAYTFGGSLQYHFSVIEIASIDNSGGGLVPGNPGNPGATTFSEARSAGTASGTGGFVNGIYTTPAGVKSLVVTLVGGGGGGANGITSQPGGNTTFGYLSAFGGGSGIGPYTDGFTGGGAGGGTAGATNGTAMTGKPGNVNGLGGVGFLGAGAGGNAYPGGANGGGGGAGGVILEETINTPAATYAYSVGRRGEDQDWAGQYVGQVGCIIVTEYY